MIKRFLPLLAALALPASAHAYNAQELLADCQAADEMFAQKKTVDPYQSVKSARCLSYVAGVADGYAVGNYLADSVGVQLNAFCLPGGPDLAMRLVRSVVIHVERTPPNTTASTATLVAGAFAKSFPCTESLEQKK